MEPLALGGLQFEWNIHRPGREREREGRERRKENSESCSMAFKGTPKAVRPKRWARGPSLKCVFLPEGTGSERVGAPEGTLVRWWDDAQEAEIHMVRAA